MISSVALLAIIVGSIMRGTPGNNAYDVRVGTVFLKTGALLVPAILVGYIGALIALCTGLVGRKVRSRTLYMVSTMSAL